MEPDASNNEASTAAAIKPNEIASNDPVTTESNEPIPSGEIKQYVETTMPSTKIQSIKAGATTSIIDADGPAAPPGTSQFVCSSVPITVEPIFFVLFFCYSLCDATGTNLILEKTCLYFNFAQGNCTGELSPFIEETIQPYAAKIIMLKSITQAIFSATLSIFIGSWTDTNKKRKPFLVLPVIGTTISYMFWLAFAYLPVDPIYAIICALPYSLSGGLISVFTCGYCYISDITTDENRAFRMSMCTIILTIGTLCGYMVSLQIYEHLYQYVYLISYGISILGLFTIIIYIFILPESDLSTEVDEMEIRKPFFDVSHAIKSIKVLWKVRPSKGRLALLLLVSIIGLDILVFEGESSLRYLSLKAKFFWTAEDYNQFSAVISGAAGTISIFGLFILNKVLGLNETTIILIVLAMSLISSVLTSLAATTLQFYIATFFNCLIVLLSAVVKSEMAHIVPSTEIGKVFAITSTVEAIAPFAAAPAYTYVYKHVVEYQPLYVYFLSSICWSIGMVLVVIIIIIHRKYGRDYHERLVEELDEENETDPFINQ